MFTNLAFKLRLFTRVCLYAQISPTVHKWSSRCVSPSAMWVPRIKFRSSGLVSSVFTLWAIFCFSLGAQSVVEDLLWLTAPNSTRTEDWVAHGNSRCHLGYGVQLFGQTPVLIFQGKDFSGEINVEISRMLCAVVLVVALVMTSNSLWSCGRPWTGGPVSSTSQTPTASALTFKTGHGCSHYSPALWGEPDCWSFLDVSPAPGSGRVPVPKE